MSALAKIPKGDAVLISSIGFSVVQSHQSSWSVIKLAKISNSWESWTSAGDKI